ncbi:MAG: hypothetical protein BWZ00_00473 [Bacteroidetes bacterium ADurb.BinA174]|nr:MAG: hypothetical protein BWZ00_00473 [Bacteroidetes bacterium ADurb.BinA174]
MTKTKNNTPTAERKDLSYFTLTLQSFLNESFPELANDKTLIEERSELAAQTYADALLAGHTHPEASELSNEVLYKGLHFSKFDMLFKVICNEFDSQMADDELRPFAMKMYPLCTDVFGKYSTDEPEFADSTDYELLYTELTGTVAIHIEENGLW